jgi:hypothetical protein
MGEAVRFASSPSHFVLHAMQVTARSTLDRHPAGPPISEQYVAVHIRLLGLHCAAVTPTLSVEMRNFANDTQFLSQETTKPALEPHALGQFSHYLHLQA